MMLVDASLSVAVSDESASLLVQMLDDPHVWGRSDTDEKIPFAASIRRRLRDAGCVKVSEIPIPVRSGEPSRPPAEVAQLTQFGRALANSCAERINKVKV